MVYKFTSRMYLIVLFFESVWTSISIYIYIWISLGFLLFCSVWKRLSQTISSGWQKFGWDAAKQSCRFLPGSHLQRLLGWNSMCMSSNCQINSWNITESLTAMTASCMMLFVYVCIVLIDEIACTSVYSDIVYMRCFRFYYMMWHFVVSLYHCINLYL